MKQDDCVMCQTVDDLAPSKSYCPDHDYTNEGKSMKQDDVREIDGWEIVKPNDLNAQQQVNGVWYMPIFGSDSLQMALEDLSTRLIEAVKGKEEYGK